MKIKNLMLKNFAKVSEISVSFDENITYLIGTNEAEKTQMIKAISDFFDPDDVTTALRIHGQNAGLTPCDMATLRTVYKYLRENTEMPEDLA